MTPFEFTFRNDGGDFRRWYHKLGSTDAARRRAFEDHFGRWITRKAFLDCLKHKAASDPAVDPDAQQRHGLRELFRLFACGGASDWESASRDMINRCMGIDLLDAIAEWPCLTHSIRSLDF